VILENSPNRQKTQAHTLPAINPNCQRLSKPTCLKIHFFLDLSWKIGDKMVYRNRGGLRSEMNAEPAWFEITGTQTFSAAGRKARCTPSRYAALFRLGFLAASPWRRTDTGI
jgi:hypothetical protein